MNKGVTSRGSIIGSRGVSLGEGGVGSVLKDLWNIGDVHNTSQHCFINTIVHIIYRNVLSFRRLMRKKMRE